MWPLGPETILHGGRAIETLGHSRKRGPSAVRSALGSLARAGPKGGAANFRIESPVKRVPPQTVAASRPVFLLTVSQALRRETLSRKIHRVLSRAGLTALSRQLSRAMDLPPMRPHRRVKGSVWGVSLVKNEADIIVPAVEHLFRQGVEGVLVADNGSTDETRALLGVLAERYPIHLACDREPGYYQGMKMDLLSDWARRAGADWIIPFDADEFWFAPGETLSEYLRSCSANIARGELHNLYPVPGIEFGQGPWRLETTPQHQVVKVAFRSCRYSFLGAGSNSVYRTGLSWNGLRVRRPGLSSSGLRVLHVPWRSYDQFRRKGRQGSEALSRTDYGANFGFHWRMLGSLGDEAAREKWDRIISGQQVEGICWSPGAPFRLVDPSTWSSWDPDGILTPEATIAP